MGFLQGFHVDDPPLRPESFRLHPLPVVGGALKKAHPADRDYPLGVDVGSMIGKIRDMLTFEGLCYAMYDYPAMVEDRVCLLYTSHFAYDSLLKNVLYF